jgi:hypothetical protein
MSGRFDAKVLLATCAGSELAVATVRRFVVEGGRAVVVVDFDGSRATAARRSSRR